MRLTVISRTLIALVVLVPMTVSAHDWHDHAGDDHGHSNPKSDKQNSERAMQLNTQRFFMLTARTQTESNQPEIAKHFGHFKNVKTRWDSDTLMIECNGLPDHDMMVGIKSWQQQVPLPQPFTGNNAWKLPLNPKLSENPISVRRNPLRGAIAIAVNGVPIFCALNNRGEDAYLLGELDKWGGHCGRGDDYHYHIAPVHLEKIVGKGNPIAYALDGFPIYGLTEADGTPVGKLDQYNGQFDSDGEYHYHATKIFPYINGGLRGVVTIRGDQVEQPRDSPVRQGMPPLRGATITDFKTKGEQRELSELTYSLLGRTAKISYSPAGSDRWTFTYTDTNGRSRTETYQRRQPRDQPRGDRPANRRPDDRGNRPPPPPQGNRRPPRR